MIIWIFPRRGGYTGAHTNPHDRRGAREPEPWPALQAGRGGVEVRVSAAQSEVW